MIKCQSCKKLKIKVEFSKNSSRSNGLNGFCKECMKKYREKNRKEYSKYNKEYKRVNKEILKEDRKKYQMSNKEKISDQVRAVKLKRRYGITTQHYDDLLIEQDYKCVICGTEYRCDKRLHVDHDHETGDVRGLLCGECNRGIGMFKDSQKLLKNAINYLNVWKTRKNQS